MNKLDEKDKKLEFPSVHLSLKEHSMLEELWKSLCDHQSKIGSDQMTKLITEGASHALAPHGDPSLEVPEGVDLNTIAIFQAIGLQMRLMDTIAVVSPKEFIATVWRLSRLYYRELLRLSGIKPEGS